MKSAPISPLYRHLAGVALLLAAPKSNIVIITLLGFLLNTVTCFCAETVGDLKLHSVFADHAILQREQPVPVYGWAQAGSAVQVLFAGQEKTATADASGKWRVVLDPMPAIATPQTLIVKADTKEIEVADVLVGDVWFCSGQSNMALLINRTPHEEEAKATPENPLFRAFSFRVSAHPTEQTDVIHSRWFIFGPKNVSSAYATAYYFGRKIQGELRIPVGLVFGALGGTQIEAWMPRDSFTTDPELESMAVKGLAANEEGLKKNQAHLASGGDPKKLPWPQWRTDQATPSWLYNGAIHPFVGMSIRGFIWYQGEHNLEDVAAYKKLFPTHIEAWRKAWGRNDLPFYFCQLPGLDEKDANRIARMRLVQMEALHLPNTGMAVIYDTAEEQDNHPMTKRPAGERLALIALAKEYRKKLEFSGPAFTGFTVTNSKVSVRFSHVGSGLIARAIPAEYYPVQRKPETKLAVRKSPGSELEGFQLRGTGGDWVWADARIKGDEVEVSSPAVPQPQAVRYAFADFGFFNLFNADGLPALPFDSTLSIIPKP